MAKKIKIDEDLITRIAKATAEEYVAMSSKDDEDEDEGNDLEATRKELAEVKSNLAELQKQILKGQTPKPKTETGTGAEDPIRARIREKISRNMK